jgi:hypothetical protein
MVTVFSFSVHLDITISIMKKLIVRVFLILSANYTIR